MPSITSCDILNPLPDQSGNGDKFLQTDGNNLSWRKIGKESIQEGAITTELIDNRSITNEKILGDTITTNEIDMTNLKNSLSLLPPQSDPETTDKILTSDGAQAFWGELDAEEAIQNETITNDKIVNKTITNEKIDDSTIKNEKIVDGTIKNEKISNNTIKNEKIFDDTITKEKIAPNTITSNEINIPELENALDTLPDQTNQDGKFLKTDGTSASWSAIEIQEQTKTLSSGRNISFPNFLDANLKNYTVFVEGIRARKGTDYNASGDTITFTSPFKDPVNVTLEQIKL